MKKSKLLCTVLAISIISSMSLSAFAVSNNDTTAAPSVMNTEIDGVKCTFVEYAKPAEFQYDGNRCVVLGYYEPVVKDYHETTRWYVTDYGITQTWVNLSAPYFLTSVAKGQTLVGEMSKKVKVDAKFGAGIPNDSKSAILSALAGDFSVSYNQEYTKTLTVKLEGPTGSANSRDFFYKLGYHKHNITVTKEVRSNWDGVISTTPYRNLVGYQPAVKYYSEEN